MRKAYDAKKPIETLFEYTEDLVEYADTGLARYNTNQISARAYPLVYNTGLYTDA